MAQEQMNKVTKFNLDYKWELKLNNGTKVGSNSIKELQRLQTHFFRLGVFGFIGKALI